jgi:hypothetical protein
VKGKDQARQHCKKAHKEAEDTNFTERRFRADAGTAKQQSGTDTTHRVRKQVKYKPFFLHIWNETVCCVGDPDHQVEERMRKIRLERHTKKQRTHAQRGILEQMQGQPSSNQQQAPAHRVRSQVKYKSFFLHI